MGADFIFATVAAEAVSPPQYHHQWWLDVDHGTVHFQAGSFAHPVEGDGSTVSRWMRQALCCTS
jgi:hypothetical protein